ncbi:MAG: ECF transporter S component [Erysipelotrichaceae bacterium]|nr:ECF transporter S component [Erysipelotrichaceae bacterium]
MDQKTENSTHRFELRDVILMSCFGILFALIYLAVFNVGMAIAAALTTTGLGDFAFDMIYGVWFMAGTLAAYIIRKPGAGLVAEVLASVVELLMGNSGGITVVITGLIQGLGTELGFAMFRYKKWDLASLTIASVLSGVFIYGYELFYLQYYLLPIGMHIGHLVIRSVSAFVFSALIVKTAGDGLARTGVLKNYAIGKTIVTSSEEDD